MTSSLTEQFAPGDMISFEDEKPGIITTVEPSRIYVKSDFYTGWITWQDMEKYRKPNEE